MRRARIRVPSPGFPLDLRRLSTTVLENCFEDCGGNYMVVKVNRSRGPVPPRPACIDGRASSCKPRRAEDIPAILANTKNYPTPVRFVGGDYSQTRCVGGDGGTTVNLSSLGKIVEFGEDEVRAQAGVRVGALVRALAERGQELPLTPEMGHMTVGAVAVTTLPQASQADGPAQMSALVKELKLVTPQGKLMTVSERNADLMRVLRSSFGLLGVVHEAVLRVQPLVPVRIDHEVLTLKEFAARFRQIVASPDALRLHISPFRDQITVERRTPDESLSSSRSGIWQIKKSVMRNVLPAFGSTVGSVLAAPGVAGAVVSGVQRALRATLPARSVVMLAHEWIRDFPTGGLAVALHLYPVGLPSGRIPETARRVLRVLPLVLQAARLSLQRRERREPSASGPLVTVQRELSGTDDHARAFLDRRPGLGRVPDRLQ